MTSLLLAPLKMLAHTRSVLWALINIPVAWAGQNRHGETGWKRAFHEHRGGITLALGWSGIAGWIGSTPLMLWSLPVMIPLLLAAPTSVVLGSQSSGRAFAKRGLLTTPESCKPMQMIRDACTGNPLLPQGLGLSNVQQAVLSPAMNTLHRQLARTRPKQTTASILQHCLEHGPEQLQHWQLSLLCQDRRALANLHNSAWQADRHSYWGHRIASLAIRTGPSMGEEFETTDHHDTPAQRSVRGAAAAALSLDTVDCS
jgi:membrane glycosyltransferase